MGTDEKIGLIFINITFTQVLAFCANGRIESIFVKDDFGNYLNATQTGSVYSLADEEFFYCYEGTVTLEGEILPKEKVE